MKAILPLATSSDVRAWAWTMLIRNRREFSLMMSLFGVATIAGLLGPQLLGLLVEGASGTATRWSVDAIALAFVGVVVIEAALRGAATMRAKIFGERVLAEAREGIVEHAVQLPISMVEAAGTGDLLSRATSDVDKLDAGLRQAAPEIIVASVTVVLTAVAMVLTSPLLALGMLAAVPLIVLADRWYRPRIVPRYQEALARWAELHSLTHETADGARTIEALDLRDGRIVANDRRLTASVDAEWRCTKLLSVFLAGLNFTYLVPIAAILLIGAVSYANGLVGLGAITTVVLYARAMADPLEEVLGWFDELQVGHAALRRILGVQLVPPDRAGDGHPVDHDISANGVRFGYGRGREILQGVDLDIAHGERLIIVGPSGAGKSTLARLLAGIDGPDHGYVRIGGADVSRLPLELRRREVALLTQEMHVFAATLRENLTLARDADDDELWEVLRTVHADQWASGLPDGLDTMLGPGGELVPPAVTQLLALARLILANPHTLVLDEATSLLDTFASRSLERSVSAVLKGRTVIAIAHRLATARSADRIAVIDGGRIVELGSHDELLRLGGSYARLVAAAGG